MSSTRARRTRPGAAGSTPRDAGWAPSTVGSLRIVRPSGHETVAARTGRDWAAWVSFLDVHEAHDLPHAEIAKLVLVETGLGWSSQPEALGYERIRGLRAVGQQRSGEFEANRSKTMPVPVERLSRRSPTTRRGRAGSTRARPSPRRRPTSRCA